MNAKEYVKNVLVTESKDFTAITQRMSVAKNIRLTHACAGISSELAELIELADSSHKTLDRVNLLEEIGDILWYVGIATDALDKVEEADPGPTIIFNLPRMDSDSDLIDAILNFTKNVGRISGELVDKVVKKTVFYGKTVDENDIIEHLLHINMNIVILLELAGFTIEQARERNIAKLKARYGSKFTEAAALDRDLEKERAILEKV